MPDTEPQVGPEMDAAVARACGWRVKIFVGDLVLVDENNSLLTGVPFCPSTDLNSAFEAAEKAGLFDEGRNLAKDGRIWFILQPDGFDPITYTVARGETAAECICRAILALHKNPS